MKKKASIYIILVFLSPLFVRAQEHRSLPETLLAAADSLRCIYHFEESLFAYDDALRAQPDSLARLPIEDKKLMSENGVSLMQFVCEPQVVASHTFSLGDFFLFYPLKDRSWVPIPNALDTLANNPFVKATYLPGDSKGLYYSCADEGGSRNIYHTEFRDTVWSAPALLNESMMSTSNEIYPMLSPDGKSLYFASSGLYGVGGYDLYVSTWDEENGDWSVPVNMGFPFSSPADDFLFVNSEDGRYSVFASNRDCSRDSVTVYVVEFDNVPVRKSVDSPDELQQLSHLIPGNHPGRIDNSSSLTAEIPDNVDTRSYVAKIKEVRALQDTISLCESALEDFRSRFAVSEDAAEKTRLCDAILDREMAIPELQDSLDRASKILQKIEMDFLFKGVVLDPEQLLAQTEREVVGASTAYAFTRQNMGKAPEMKIEKPVKKFDYSFRILPEGRFAEDNTLPSGLVYQIQLFSLGSPATVVQIKGLSPVFESRNGVRYVYRVGVFRRYSDAIGNLNSVKKAGFRDAIICAFNDGKAMSISQAKKMEATIVTNYKVTVNTGSDEMPPAVSTTIREFCDKDVIKVRENGMTVFVIAAFSDKAMADELASLIRATGQNNVSVEEIPNEE